MVGPIAVVGAVMAARPAIRRSAFGFVSGVGLLLIYVAWVRRSGPGTTCWQSGASSGCDQHLNPLPWLIAGLACSPAALWVTRGEPEDPRLATRQVQSARSVGCASVLVCHRLPPLADDPLPLREVSNLGLGKKDRVPRTRRLAGLEARL